jgi:hypothetical protein
MADEQTTPRRKRRREETERRSRREERERPYRGGRSKGLKGPLPFDRPSGFLSPAKARELAGRTQPARRKRMGEVATGGVLKRARQRAERLGIENVPERITRGQAVQYRQRLKAIRESKQPGAGRAQNLQKVGITAPNVIEQGPGAERRGQYYQVAWDPVKKRYAHVYGRGKKAERRYLRRTNPWTAVYGEKPGQAAKRMARQAGKLTPIGLPRP